MKRNKLLAYSLCTLLLTGCNSSLLNLDNDTSDNDITTEDEIIENSSSINDSSSSVQDETDNISDDELWKSPMADYVPEAPYSNYIEFVKGNTTTNSGKDNISDFIGEDFKYACCDLSGDGIEELVLLSSDDEGEKISVLGYDADEDTVRFLRTSSFNSKYDRISKNGFILFFEYENESGEFIHDKTDDTSYPHWIYVIAPGCRHDNYDLLFSWIKEAGSNEYVGALVDYSEDNYNKLMNLASDQVEFFEAKEPEDMIPYLEECDESFEESYREYKYYRQQGNGIFHSPYTFNISDIPDNEYEDADTAYEAFHNNETSVRCEYIKEVNQDFGYFYGDKFTLSNWSFTGSLDSYFIDCGNDGDQELVIHITDDDNKDVEGYTYVINYYEGHLYLRFVASNIFSSYIEIDEKGFINIVCISGMYISPNVEAFFDSNVEYQEIYQFYKVGGKYLEDYLPDVYEKEAASAEDTILIYEIGDEKYYVPYYDDEVVTDESDYTDFMKACVDGGLSFSTQKEVDALVEEKRAEYGF